MRRLETIFIVIGLLFYGWFVRSLGVHSVYENLRLVGWGLGITIAMEALARIANTLGWRVVIEKCPPSLTLSKLFFARIAGEAVDYTTPSAQLGGQLVMAMMVRRELPIAAGLASVVIASLAEALGQIAFICVALLLSIRLAASFTDLFWPIVGGLAITIGLAGAFFYVQRKRPFFHIWKAAARLDLPMLATIEVGQASQEADEILDDFYRHSRWRLAVACLFYLFAWSLGPVEIYLLLAFMGQKATVEIALLTEALGLLIERATFMIPAKLVSQEGGKALILGMLGYRAGVGFSVGLLRRIKELVWVLFGLSSLGIYRLGEARTNNARVAEQPVAAVTAERPRPLGRRTEELKGFGL
jgi:glycosyltransferase 2 family protein